MLRSIQKTTHTEVERQVLLMERKGLVPGQGLKPKPDLVPGQGLKESDLTQWFSNL